MSDDEKAVREWVVEWMRASKAGEIERVLGMMTEDAVFQVAGREPFGKEAFAAASRGQAGMRIEGRAEVVEVEVHGEWAWMRNRLRIEVTPAGGGTVVRSGYTLTILRKEEGRWKLARDANLLAVEKG